MENLLSNSKHLLNSDFFEIAGNYCILHFDEFPILFTGSNKFGNVLVGSHLDIDYETKKIFELSTIVTSKDYYEFVHGKISYLDILSKSSSIGIIEKDINFKICNVYQTKFEFIPADYLPLEESFCPVSEGHYSLNYEIILRGKLADINKAASGAVSKIQNEFSEFLSSIVSSLRGLSLAPKVLLNIYSEGSFKINFELDVQKKDQLDMFIDQANLDEYVSSYIKYISNDFINDIEFFENNTGRASLKMLELVRLSDQIYGISAVNRPEDLINFVKDGVIRFADKFDKMSEQVGDGFDTLEIINFGSKNDVSLGFIDISFANKIHSTLEAIELSVNDSSVDTSYKNYTIYIYQLNTDKRSGYALIKDIDSDKEMSKPRIKINGSEGLDQTKYTESIYLNKWIDVKAKATKVGNKFSFLDVAYESY